MALIANLINIKTQRPNKALIKAFTNTFEPLQPPH